MNNKNLLKLRFRICHNPEDDLIGVWGDVEEVTFEEGTRFYLHYLDDEGNYKRDKIYTLRSDFKIKDLTITFNWSINEVAITVKNFDFNRCAFRKFTTSVEYLRCFFKKLVAVDNEGNSRVLWGE